VKISVFFDMRAHLRYYLRGMVLSTSSVKPRSSGRGCKRLSFVFLIVLNCSIVLESTLATRGRCRLSLWRQFNVLKRLQIHFQR